VSDFKSLDNILMIISSYGDVLESLSSLTFKPESALPHPKDVIKNAIITAHQTLSTDKGRRLVHENYRHDIAEYILGPNYRECLASGIMLLSEFVPDEEAALGNQVYAVMQLSNEKKNPDMLIDFLQRIPEAHRDKFLQLHNRINDEGRALLAELHRMSPDPDRLARL
jgi:hypothetical protein